MSDDVVWGPLILMSLFGSIASRLRELGWGDELDHMQSCDYAPLRGHKCLKHPQQLTDESTPSFFQPDLFIDVAMHSMGSYTRRNG